MFFTDMFFRQSPASVCRTKRLENFGTCQFTEPLLIVKERA